MSTVVCNEDSTVIVADHGAEFSRVGIAGDDVPSCVFYPPPSSSHANQRFRRRAEEPWVVHWGDVERLWYQTYHEELHLAPEEHPLLLTSHPHFPMAYKERTAQLLFETFKVPALYTAMQAVLSLFTSGRASGVVFSSGDKTSQVVPIYEGCVLTHGVESLDTTAGKALTVFLCHLLTERGYSFTTAAEREIVRDIKEKLCYVADADDTPLLSSLSREREEKRETRETREESYELPDGQVITLGSELHRCPEALFHPSLTSVGDNNCYGDEYDNNYNSLQQSVFRSINSCDRQLRDIFYNNILLSGGNTMFKGIDTRLTKELSTLAQGAVNQIRVVAPAERKYSVWIGGSIMASLSTFKEMWISKAEYEEIGPRVVHMKCGH